MQSSACTTVSTVWRTCTQLAADGCCRSDGETCGCRLYGFAQLGVMPSLAMLEAVGIEAQRQLSGFGPQVRRPPCRRCRWCCLSLWAPLSETLIPAWLCCGSLCAKS